MGERLSHGNAPAGRSEEMKVSALHFVLKNPMRGPWPEGFQRAVFATGCFWGTEKRFWTMPGVYSTAVGYINGATLNPTYREVCGGDTGHTEAVQVVFDPSVVRFTDLLKPFWESHDPTQVSLAAAMLARNHAGLPELHRQLNDC